MLSFSRFNRHAGKTRSTRLGMGGLSGISGMFLAFAAFSMPHAAQGADIVAGEARYMETCVNCHGQAGKGAGSFPKISGKEVSYTIEKLEAYRAKIKQGSNSFLMFPMAEPLSDEEIANLAAYLEGAKYSVE